MGYSLTNNTKYYYRLRLCDNNNKCAISRCSSFLTAESSSKCGFCKSATRIKVPDSWVVSYDVDRDGTYEHTQGQVCGLNAGMKSNYTMRRVNIKLAKSDGSTYFEFINSSLSKTGLNDKVRSMSGSGSILTGTNLAGLNSETRDKIINNLHPEVCRIKISTSGTCSGLFHCDDSGNNCTDRTSEATLIDSTNCLWELPYCEFSTYKTTVADSSSTSSGGGGGGGGGGIIKGKNATVSAEGTGEESSDAGVGIAPAEGTTSETATEPEQTNKKTGSIVGAVVWTSIIVIVIVVAIVAVSLRKKRRKRMGLS